jgi:hypothetical protein
MVMFGAGDAIRTRDPNLGKRNTVRRVSSLGHACSTSDRGKSLAEIFRGRLQQLAVRVDEVVKRYAANRTLTLF